MVTSSYEVHVTNDPAAALAAWTPYLAERPVEHNVLLTVMATPVTSGTTGSYWQVVGEDEVVGVAMLSDPAFPLALSVMDPAVAQALAERVAADYPSLSAASGVARTAAAFAGHFAEVARLPAAPVAGMRLYELGELHPPTGVPGNPRAASPDDRKLLVDWTIRFGDEAHATVVDPDAIVDLKLAQDRFWLWEYQGEVVSVAAGTEPVAAHVRVQNVYTPSEHRGRGYAAANVAALAADCQQRDGANSILYTDLANPTSNAVYRRIGFEPIAEVVVYEFGEHPLRCRG